MCGNFPRPVPVRACRPTRDAKRDFPATPSPSARQELVVAPARRCACALGIENRIREFLVEGGFPETQGLAAPLRIELLQGYADTVFFRDVVERYGVSQVAALRWLVRQCLRNPAGSFSVHRLHQDLKAQGHGIAKDAAHALLGHLMSIFLLSAVPLATASERRRNSNPRKLHPADPGLIKAFDASGRSNVGHALETAVLNELDRRRAEVGYVKTPEGLGVDFLARYLGGAEELIQVCADVSAGETLARVNEPGVEVQPASDWLLNTPNQG